MLRDQFILPPEESEQLQRRRSLFLKENFSTVMRLNQDQIAGSLESQGLLSEADRQRLKNLELTRQDQSSRYTLLM